MIRIVDLFAFMLIVVLGFGIWGYKNGYIGNKKESFVVLDVMAIVEAQKDKVDAEMRLANKILTQKEIEAIVTKQVVLLEKLAKKYAEENDLLIIERGAVVAGDIKDITDEFIKAL